MTTVAQRIEEIKAKAKARGIDLNARRVSARPAPSTVRNDSDAVGPETELPPYG